MEGLARILYDLNCRPFIIPACFASKTLSVDVNSCQVVPAAPTAAALQAAEEAAFQAFPSSRFLGFVAQQRNLKQEPRQAMEKEGRVVASLGAKFV